MKALEKALYYCHEALACDERDQPVEAFENYVRAIDYFLHAAKGILSTNVYTNVPTLVSVNLEWMQL
jgi:hypothetical protein